MMTPIPSSPELPPRGRRSALWGIFIFAASVGVMGFLRLYVFRDRFIAFAYGLPMLVCLWHRDRRLLWSMALVFTAISAYKAFVLQPDARPAVDEVEGLLQIASILILAGSVHGIGVLADRLAAKNEALARANDLLTAGEEEVGRQNEELQAQAEELQQQFEEITQQAEQLARQSQELQALNTGLEERQKLLQSLLESFKSPVADRQVLERICRSLLNLFGGEAAAAAVVERAGNDVALRALAGAAAPESEQWPFESSFASVVMAYGRTAYVDDLASRPDLSVLRPKGGGFRSVLAAPLELSGTPAGAVQVYADSPRQWTNEEFGALEWVAGQCSLVLEARRLQKELARSNARLEEQVKERTAELRGLVEELEHFSYTITHDMRAPLRAMQGFAELLMEKCHPALDEDCRDYLRRIVTAAGRMDRLITDSLLYSRTGREEMALTRLDPLALLRGIVESYPAFQMPLARIDLPEAIPPVIGNQAGLTQCVSNLLGNAVKFVESGRLPHVVVRAESAGGRLRLWFEDNGIGIPPEMLPRIFGMFQRASKEYEGTGIGLALVRKMAERMRGSVGVESELGKGSRFWLELQRAP